MKKNEMQKRARKAAANYMEQNGFEILDRNHMGFIVAWEGDTLVFAKLAVKVGAFPDDPAERCEFEEAMMMWLLANDIVDVPIRRDEVALAVAGDDRAGLRYWRQCC